MTPLERAHYYLDSAYTMKDLLPPTERTALNEALRAIDALLEHLSEKGNERGTDD